MADFSVVRGPQNEVHGLWVRDPNVLNDPENFNYLLQTASAPADVLQAARAGAYRVVPNTVNADGGVFVMFANVPAPGESPGEPDGMPMEEPIGGWRESLENIKPSYIVGAVFALGAMATIVLVVLVLLLSSGGGDGEQVGQASPTPPDLTAQASLTQSPVAGAKSPTPLPTVAGASASSTPLGFSTSAPPPTQIASGQQPGQQQPAVTAIGITSPTPGVTLRGNVAILGSASHPNFVQYALEYGPSPNPTNLWFPITSVPITTTVINNALGAWNTTSVPDGNYQVRLHVWLGTGVEDFRVVSGLQVRNTNTQPPSSTNSNPSISSVGPVTITKGKAITLALGMTDPDNDPLTYLAQVSSPSIATITPSGASAITINALNAGATNVTISINDGRGGTASTSFTVTVVNPVTPSNPPSIAPIPAQSLVTNTTLNISVVVSDPDAGDTVNLTTSASDASVVTASVSGNTLTISGKKQGSAGINVTATDSKGLSSTASFVVTVTDPIASNRGPNISAIGGQSVNANQTIDVSFTATDPDNDVLTLSATSGNNGVASAVIVGTNIVRVNGVAGGSTSITVQANDNKGGVASTSFTVTVIPPPSPNNAPTIQNIGNQTVDVGSSKDVTAQTNDADGDPVSLSTSTNPTGVASISVNGNILTITGDSAGTTTVTVTASDGTDSVQTTFSVTVNAPPAGNNAPTISAIGAQSVTEGSTFDLNVSANDLDGDPLTYSATFNPGGVASVSNVAGSIITISGDSAGSTTVTVTVDDGTDTASTDFSLTVDPPAPTNNPPTVDPIGAQNVTQGSTVDVSVSANDVDGDPLTYSATFNPGGVASVSNVAGNVITFSGDTIGATTVTVTVNDGQASATTDFTLNVNAPANNPPTVDPIGAQSVAQGGSVDVSVSANDADGDPLTYSATFNPGGVASVSNVAGNVITFSGDVAGATTVTVTVNDGQASATTDFSLNVNAPANNPPTVDPIGAQSVTQGSTVDVSVSANDADGDPLTYSASFNPPGFASQFNVAGNVITISGDAAGATTVTVSVSDGTDTATTDFSLTVDAPAPVNNAPTIDPIANVTVDEGSSVDVTVNASDIDGDIVTITAVGVPGTNISTSVNGNIVTVTGLTAGGDSVTVNADDGRGEANSIASTSFNVTVNAAGPTFDISTVPELPDIGSLFSSLNPIYQSGQGFGNRSTVFSVAGDDPVNSTDFLDGFAAPPPYTLGNYPGLETVINHYNTQAAHDTLGDPATSFNVVSEATGSGWTIEHLFNSAFSSGNCNAGEAPLACELRLSRPAVLIVSFTPGNASATPVDVFTANLQQVVGTATGSGVIPVLVTLPDDGTLDAGTLANYNEAIVTVANNSNVPVWNLWQTMQGATNGVYASSGDPADLTDPALAFGANRRNWAALRVLEAIKNVFFP